MKREREKEKARHRLAKGDAKRLMGLTLGGMLLGAVALFGSGSALAADVPAGTIIDAANWGEMQNNTFEGKRIGDMISPSIAMLVQNHKKRIYLQPTDSWPVNEQLVNFTQMYKDKVSLDASSPRVNGYVAGIPFPDVTQNDPDAGLKVVYNIVYSAFLGDVMDWPYMAFVMVNQSGYERSIKYKFSLYQMIGRRTDGTGNHTEGDGSIRSLTTLVAVEPFDVRGLGTFAVRYVDGRYDDVYAYLRAVRRWRRLSGSAWYDPVQGSDYLNDETSNGFNADPSWYKSYTILGRKSMLFPESASEIYYEPEGTTIESQMPKVAINTPPYWNLKSPQEEIWRPRDVWIVEAIPPEGHPMSKRVLFVDADPYFPVVFESDGYDLTDSLWHIYVANDYRTLTDDGYPTLSPTWGYLVDVKKLSATLLPGTPGRHYNPPGKDVNDFNLAAITRLLQ